MRFRYTNIISSDRDTGAHFSSLFFFVCVFYFNLSAGGEWAAIRGAFRPQDCKMGTLFLSPATSGEQE